MEVPTMAGSILSIVNGESRFKRRYLRRNNPEIQLVGYRNIGKDCFLVIRSRGINRLIPTYKAWDVAVKMYSNNNDVLTIFRLGLLSQESSKGGVLHG